jgi:hypothetical protein
MWNQVMWNAYIKLGQAAKAHHPLLEASLGGSWQLPVQPAVVPGLHTYDLVMCVLHALASLGNTVVETLWDWLCKLEDTAMTHQVPAPLCLSVCVCVCVLVCVKV